MIDDKQGEFRPERGCVDQIFTLKQIAEKAWEKILECMGFMNLGKAYDRVNREALSYAFPKFIKPIHSCA